MATIVKDIFDAITTTTQTELGSTWNKLRRVYAPELNDFRTGENAFAVKHLSASSADTTLRFYTLDHLFEVILSRSFVERLSDDEIQIAINDLYDQADKLLVKFFISKLGIPANVMIVDQPSLSEPEVLENQLVILRVGFNVKYRNQVT
jgi:hypothetical protein